MLGGSIMAAIMGDAADRLVLGGFVLREQIGEGGFGTVYRAEQRALGRAAVVKVLRALARAPTRRASSGSLREAQLASRLDHPYAAHIYAFGVEPDGMLWIAMELVRGHAARRAARAQRPAAARAVRAAVRAALRGRAVRARAGHRPSRHQAGERHGAPHARPAACRSCSTSGSRSCSSRRSTHRRRPCASADRSVDVAPRELETAR